MFDFETYKHIDINKPNHVEIDILQIDKLETHNYGDCLFHSLGINGYGCEANFCDWLFTEKNADSTVIAHNGAGYDKQNSAMLFMHGDDPIKLNKTRITNYVYEI